MAERTIRLVPRILGGSALVLAGIGQFLLSAPAANAAVVPPPAGAIIVGTPSATCHSPLYSTISAAVTAAAANAIIYVCAGTYPESVTVTKNLTLLGAQWGVPGTSRINPANETVITSSTGEIIYNGAATTGTINGFTLRGPVGAAQNGIVVLNNIGTGYTWIDNIITGNQSGINFHSTGATPTKIAFNLIADNTAAGSASGQGVFLASGPASNVSIVSNSFAGNLTAINTTGVGAVEGPLSQNLTISKNISVNDGNFVVMFLAENVQVTLNRITWTNPTDTGAGSAIYISGGNQNVGISQNIVTGGASDGINVNNAFYSTLPTTNLAISGNTITRRLNGIHISASVNEGPPALGVTISGNTVQAAGLGDLVTTPDTGGNGIWLQGGSGVTLTGNAAGNSVSTDCRDETTGGGTAGTANTWLNDFGMTSSPLGLCMLPT